jgi:hypothetical protein
VDIAQCPECGKAWEISYKVADMTRVPSWDGLTRQQQEAAEAEQKERDKLTRKVAFEKLKTEFDPD